MVYDGFLLVAITWAYSALHLFVKVQLLGKEYIEQSPTAGGDPLLLVGVYLCCCGFFCWFWIKNGQTLGMQSWRLRVEDLSGENISLKQAVMRLLVAPLSLLVFGWGYLRCFNGKKPCWHDEVAKSRVRVLPKGT
jgi:uncharacterized RDD family membrane protein YckC